MMPSSRCDIMTGQRRSTFDCVFFFNDTATTEIYTLSLHDALPIYGAHVAVGVLWLLTLWVRALQGKLGPANVTTVEITGRSEEHTSELQSQSNLVCRLLLEKKHKIARA